MLSAFLWWECLTPVLLLTAEDFDAGSVQVVLSTNQRPHADDKEVTKAGDEGHDPHRHPQHHVSEQVFEGRDAIRVGFTGPDVRRIGAVLELLKIAGRKRAVAGKKKKERKIVKQYHKEEMKKHVGYSGMIVRVFVLNIHVGEVLHGKKHLSLDIWDLNPL